MHKWIRPFGGVSFFPKRWRERSHRRSGNNMCFPLTTCLDKHKSQTLVGRKLGHLVSWARNGTAARENIPQPAASCICFSSKPATFCAGAHWHGVRIHLASHGPYKLSTSPSSWLAAGTGGYLSCAANGLGRNCSSVNRLGRRDRGLVAGDQWWGENAGGGSADDKCPQWVSCSGGPTVKCAWLGSCVQLSHSVAYNVREIYPC